MNTPTKVSTIVIGFMITLLVLIAGGNFIVNTLNSTNTQIEDSSGFSGANFTHFKDSYYSDTLNVTERFDSTLQQTTDTSSGLGALEIGWDFLKNLWRVIINIFTLGGIMKTFTQDISTSLNVPPEITLLIIAIVVVTIVFVVINAMRRWNT